MTWTRLSQGAYSLMRFIIGILFACHGAQKLLPVFGGPMATGKGGLMLAAGVIELVGGFLVAVGFLTRAAALICCGEMAVAYFKAHAPQSFFPLVNKGELAVAYCFAFLFIAAAGAGAYSLDRLIFGEPRTVPTAETRAVGP